MGCDAVVALGRATVDGNTLFACNTDRPARECQALVTFAGRAFSPGEKVRTRYLELPQVRQTFTVLGSQPAGGWGFSHGVNEHRLAIGCGTIRSKLCSSGPGLLGPELVRLALERCRSGRQALDLICDLVQRHGQGVFPDCPPDLDGDHAFLVADPQEAYVLEAAGNSWVYQQVREVRAVSNVSIIGQDWDWICPGLSGHAIAQGWWPGDGSKLDFAGALAEDPVGRASALRRWGRATMLLEQQNGHIDAPFLRRLLGDHYEGMHSEVDPLVSVTGPVPLCQHGTSLTGFATAGSMVVALPAEPHGLPAAWCAFGPPCAGVFFPIFLTGELPEAFSRAGPEPSADSLWWRVYLLHEQLRREPQRWGLARETFARLQAALDQDAEEFAGEGASLVQRGAAAEANRLAAVFMQHNLERFEEVLDNLTGTRKSGVTPRPAVKAGSVQSLVVPLRPGTLHG